MNKMLMLILLLLVPFVMIGSTNAQAGPMPMPMDEPMLPVPNALPQTTMVQFGGLVIGTNYLPKIVIIAPGDHVQWNGDFVMHPLVSDEALWTTVNSGSQFDFVFNTPGVYHFHCLIHGAFGMTGIVMVGSRTFLPQIQ